MRHDEATVVGRPTYSTRRVLLVLSPAIVIGLWAVDGEVARAAVRLKAAGADDVVTTLHGAVQRVRQHAPEASEASVRTS